MTARRRSGLPGIAGLARALRASLPAGRPLPEDVWRRRHRGIVAVAFAHAVGVPLFAIVRGYPVAHSLAEGGIVAVAAVLAASGRMGRTARALSATFGLMTSSALLVHFSGGVIETHFHFFVMLAVISLYQHWTPFLLAIGYVVAHHGLVGFLEPQAVYNHPAAWANPWKWAGIHGMFVLAASVANLVAWRLNESARAQFELLLTSAGEGIFGLDRDGRCTFVNAAAARMTGWDPADLVGRQAHDLIHPTDAEGRPCRWERCAIRAALDGEHVRSDAQRFFRRDGTGFPVELVASPVHEHGRIDGAVVTFADVTDRKRSEATLNDTLSLLSATLESTADGILVVDAEGRITSLNRKFVEMWRIPEEVVASRDDAAALAFVLDQLKDPEGFLRKVRELYATPDAESEDVLHFKDGRVFERYSQPQRVDGVSMGRVWSFRDATERYRLDEMKNAFLSAVSHELRTPLTAVLGFALTLEASLDALTPEQQRQAIARLAANATKLERLLTDILDLDRLSRGIFEPRRNPTDLAGLVRRVARETDALTDRPVHVEAQELVIDVEAAKIERVVENLLTNAVRHTPEGTPVWVRVWEEDAAAVIAVEDSGPGVPEDLKQAVFESFRQGPSATPHSPGVGIGLSLVARFAELHGGRAWVEDREGGGASFRVSLPGPVRAVPHVPARAAR